MAAERPIQILSTNDGRFNFYCPLCNWHAPFRATVAEAERDAIRHKECKS